MELSHDEHREDICFLCPSAEPPGCGPHTALITHPHTSCQGPFSDFLRIKSTLIPPSIPARNPNYSSWKLLCTIALIPTSPASWRSLEKLREEQDRTPLLSPCSADSRQSPEAQGQGTEEGTLPQPGSEALSKEEGKAPERRDVVITAIDGTNWPAPHFLRQLVSRKSEFQALGAPTEPFCWGWGRQHSCWAGGSDTAQGPASLCDWRPPSHQMSSSAHQPQSWAQPGISPKGLSTQ